MFRRLIPWVFVGLFAAAISRGDSPGPLLDLAVHREYDGGQGLRVLPLAADAKQVEIEFLSGGKVRHRSKVRLVEFRHLAGWLSSEFETLARAGLEPPETRGRCGLGRFRYVSEGKTVDGEICENPARRNFREPAAAARILRAFGDRYWPVNEGASAR